MSRHLLSTHWARHPMGFKVNIGAGSKPCNFDYTVNDRRPEINVSDYAPFVIHDEVQANVIGVDFSNRGNMSANLLTRKAVRQFGDALQTMCKSVVVPILTMETDDLSHAKGCICAVCFGKRVINERA